MCDMGFELNHIENSGMDVFYRVNGVEKDFPIIFVHGLAGDSRFFHNQLKYFGNFFKTIAIDLPGHGRSSYSAGQSIALYNSSIEAVVRKEKIDKYILAGHSMGGVICLDNYLKHKEKVKALILISTSSTLPVSKSLIDASINDFDNFFNRMLPRIFHKKAGIFILAAQRTISEKERNVITADLQLCSKINYEEYLEEIETPVLLIANKYYRMIPAHLTEKMKWKIKNSKIIILDQEGHVPFFENSDEFNMIMDNFIKSIQ
jgi:pimeloyl-ACP methyl ester carboxylesterase